MLSKSQAGFVKSVHQKKFRKEHGLFLAEGIKSVTEFARSDYEIDTIFSTAFAVPKMVNLSQKIKIHSVTETELLKISNLTTPQHVLALIKIPSETVPDNQVLTNRFSLVLDGLQDPGNLGTIIRTADWFGINHIICSDNTVEAYNPKVVQATMGSLSRVSVYYTDLPAFLNNITLPVFGAVLNGPSIYQTCFANEGLLVLGNEGQGISKLVEAFIQHPVTIPRFGKAESLNVAISASVFCSEIKRYG